MPALGCALQPLASGAAGGEPALGTARQAAKLWSQGFLGAARSWHRGPGAARGAPFSCVFLWVVTLVTLSSGQASDCSGRAWGFMTGVCRPEGGVAPSIVHDDCVLLSCTWEDSSSQVCWPSRGATSLFPAALCVSGLGWPAAVPLRSFRTGCVRVGGAQGCRGAAATAAGYAPGRRRRRAGMPGVCRRVFYGLRGRAAASVAGEPGFPDIPLP